ncbi:UDP-2,4-diacetamido-2,4,6-trideoxy-beta-L-altropyranose hydrolase [Roseospira navarrensis]|uniref:UDP-2,4-diacetamido-2,4, 6-trideoxy-beta-L-altropyranose hydrolase n=1 Tax=Roseospira navarrensis TaxID=140058 RepID=A0A7X1ZJL5_9PROT|nr:UDP-2,4-diacetamido-2,4,6-trideoxy-beta-L-altropyranose hydrolase [Roseospira navarrensis]MQX38445.1 UDP-2,4-diacetamido-2,4,6-trideoxy-beta-L-altropyranose hydrolase [Roseospira navarrensis]
MPGSPGRVVVVRADASRRMGTGHVLRGLTLAGALRDLGAAVRVVCRAHPGHLMERIAAEGFPVAGLPAPAAGDDSWLGASEPTDAEETIAALAGARPDWLIVDHYALGAAWEQALRPHVGAILAVDDLADRPHTCDALLDANLHPDPEARYDGLVPDGCRLLCGPWFAPLRPEYAAARRRRGGPRAGPVRRVLVFYGGSDASNETARALRVLSRPPFRAMGVDVVVGANHPDPAGIAALAAARPNITLHGPRPHLADLMAAADVALGAGGVSVWERATLGLPSLLTVTAANQAAQVARLEETGAVWSLGPVEAVTDDALADTMAALCDDTDARAGQAAAAFRLTDGRGAARVAEALCPDPDRALTARPATPADAALYFRWLNDPETRRQAFQTQPVPWAIHAPWFAAALEASDRWMRVAETPAGVPVGQVRLDRAAHGGIVSFGLDPLFRGRGWGPRLLHMARETWAGEARQSQPQPESRPQPLHGFVRPDNAASLRSFRRAGFVEAASRHPDAPAGSIDMVWTPPDPAQQEAPA